MAFMTRGASGLIQRSNQKRQSPMLRDIDYAAVAVKNALLEKFGRKNSLEDLSVVAGEKTISVRDGQRHAEETRDNLLAGLRKADSYDSFWEIFAQPKS